MARDTFPFPLIGGLDLVTPAIAIPPGRCIAAVNYEPVARGYKRQQGFERYDGQPKPSAASYSILDFDAGTAAINEGDTVTGATSGATGKALIAAVVESGSYGGSDAAGYNVLTTVSGAFQDNENLQVSAATKSVCDGVLKNRGADTAALDDTYIQDAIETARALIAAVPGSGAVRGIWLYQGLVYAVRDNAGATAGVLHKQTTSGWSPIALGREMAFTSGGTYEVEEGDVITGASSGATATITRVPLQSGTWAGGDAVGYFIFASQTGTFQSETLNVGANTNVATIAADSSAITLSVGGPYRTINYNFFGASDLRRTYGCNGVDRGFEFDGTVFVPIKTGMTSDKPKFVAPHKKHLFFGFAGGSLQHSALGDPYPWTVILGASELGIGEELTGLLSSVLGVLNIFGRNKILVLRGNDNSDWVLDELADDAGAIADTAQRIGTPIYLDDLGLRSLSTTQAFGDFQLGTITQLIEPLFQSKRDQGLTPIASMRVRAKDMYRLFWSDGSGISVYFGHKEVEILPFDLGKNVVLAISGEDTGGVDTTFIADSAGFVYQMDVGTSFDGAAVIASLRLPYNHMKTPARNKRIHKANFELDPGGTPSIALVPDFDYGDADQPSNDGETFTITGGGASFWDVGFWDVAIWSSFDQGSVDAYIDGLGRNISMTLSTKETYEEPHTLHGITMHYSFRGLDR